MANEPSFFDKMKKKLFKEESKIGAAPISAVPGGPKVWAMSPEMQLLFAEKGVKYNMKIVIRGMRKTGKSALLAQLNGHPFPFDKYVPSHEISAATIRHELQDGSEEGVKVEIWDVVDEGCGPAASSPNTSGKNSSKGGAPIHMPLLPADANNIDVYRGCHCVIFTVDVRNKETFDYVQNEARKVPKNACILVCLNFTDCPPAAKQVSDKECDQMCQNLARATTPLITQASKMAGEVDRSLSVGASWIHTALHTGEGMKALRTFLTIAVFMVKLQTLEDQMRFMYRGMEHVQAELMAIRADEIFQAKMKAKGEVEESILSPSPRATTPPRAPSPPSKIAPSLEHQKDTQISTSKKQKKGGSENGAKDKSSSEKSPAASSSSPINELKLKQSPSPNPRIVDSEDDDPAKINDNFFNDVSDDEPEEEKVPQQQVAASKTGGKKPPNQGSAAINKKQEVDHPRKETAAGKTGEKKMTWQQEKKNAAADSSSSDEEQSNKGSMHALSDPKHRLSLQDQVTQAKRNPTPPSSRSSSATSQSSSSASLNHEDVESPEVDRRVIEEAERKANEAQQRAQEESDRQAKEEAERKAQAEKEKKRKAEEAKKAKEEAERKRKEDADKKAKEETDRLVKEEADRKAKEEAEREKLSEAIPQNIDGGFFGEEDPEEVQEEPQEAVKSVGLKQSVTSSTTNDFFGSPDEQEEHDEDNEDVNLKKQAKEEKVDSSEGNDQQQLQKKAKVLTTSKALTTKRIAGKPEVSSRRTQHGTTDSVVSATSSNSSSRKHGRGNTSSTANVDAPQVDVASIMAQMQQAMEQSTAAANFDNFDEEATAVQKKKEKKEKKEKSLLKKHQKQKEVVEEDDGGFEVVTENAE